ncbi:MAG: hypothetical protein KAR08_10540 [Candidatus Heimdallarchaeota archaeon]|nr:hypothetical protein [Candidatus Heimdallarchaeota archaeon]
MPIPEGHECSFCEERTTDFKIIKLEIIKTFRKNFMILLACRNCFKAIKGLKKIFPKDIKYELGQK